MSDITTDPNDAITLRQWLIENAWRGLIEDTPTPTVAAWPLALEAASTTLMEHPELDPDELRTRAAWQKVTG